MKTALHKEDYKYSLAIISMYNIILCHVSYSLCKVEVAVSVLVVFRSSMGWSIAAWPN